MIEVTPKRIREQCLREKQTSYKLGKEKAENRNNSLKKSGSRSQAASGVALRRNYIESIAHLMAEDLITNARTCQYEEADFYEYMMSPGVLDFVRLEDLANIGLSKLLDSCASKVNKYYKLTTLQVDIGDAVEHQARLVKVEQTNPKFIDKLTERIFKIQRASTEKKHQALKLELEMLEQEDSSISWDAWNHERKAVVGSWILMAVTRSLNTIIPAEDEDSDDEILPWFKVTHVREAHSKYPTRFIYMTDEGALRIDALDKMAEELAYQCLTMLVPPNPWVRLDSGRYSGGYYSKGPGQVKNLIHGPQVLVETEPSETALAFLNRVQAQPWQINTTMFKLIKYFQQMNIEIGPFASYNKDAEKIPRVSDALLELPETDPRRIEAQREVWNAVRKQKDLRRKAAAPNQVMAMAEENLGRIFYIPWFFDSRLRAYPIVTMLSPQGTDYQKALLEFADGAEVTDENWEDARRIMLIGIATTYGNKKDKLSFAGRIEFAEQWLEDNLDAVVANPKESFAIWSQADEPFQHLALMLEYHRVFIEDPKRRANGEQVTSICRVPIGFDQTCSGLQLLGSFVRDEETCRLVNVTPSPEPQDAYAAVARQARLILEDKARWQAEIKGMEDVEEHGIPLDKIDRKVAKKVVMLIPYGGTYDTLKGHVQDAVAEWDTPIEFMEVHYLTKALIKGMEYAVPGFSALNQWFKDAGKEVMHSGKETVQWRTAAGSAISQHYREPLTAQAKTFLINKATYTIKQVKKKSRNQRGIVKSITVKAKDQLAHTERVDNPQIFKGWGDVLERKNQTALAANWTHSQDAATLQLAFANFDLPFATVHDCVYAPAPVIPFALVVLKEAFVSVVTWEALQEFERLNDLSIGLPPIGTADVTKALESDYLFS